MNGIVLQNVALNNLTDRSVIKLKLFFSSSPLKSLIMLTNQNCTAFVSSLCTLTRNHLELDTGHQTLATRRWAI